MIERNRRLFIILVAIAVVFLSARFIAYLRLEQALLPNWLFPTIGSFRLHHFVYGNIIIVITSFLSIGLGPQKNKNILAACYGIGLGLVLDEFPHWMGYVPELMSNKLWIPVAPMVVASVMVALLAIIFIREFSRRHSD